MYSRGGRLGGAGCARNWERRGCESAVTEKNCLEVIFKCKETSTFFLFKKSTFI